MTKMQPIEFDVRTLRNTDDGYDFEDFVFACLRLEPDAPTLLKRLARGRDGAIDLISEQPGETLVVECKFVGRDSKTRSLKRWKEVETNLKKHLPSLSANPESNKRSPYRRWLDTVNPVTRYWICVSETLTNIAAQDLRDEICNAFDELSKEPGLGHLACLASTNQVRVFSWDNFHEYLVRSPPLRYRWFGGLPQGLLPIETQRSEQGGFRDFLHEGGLPYFSRALYAEKHHGSNILTENMIIGQLADETDTIAIILTGPGGVGKTRLSLELSRKMIKKNWSAFRLTSLATGATIDQLLRDHQDKARVLLLLDYAETAKSLEGIAEAIQRGIDEGGHSIGLICNCRASSFYPTKQAVMALNHREHHLASSKADEKNFTAWITDRILASGKIPNRTEIARVCRGVPALAAFALFLHQTNPDQFDAQFGALHSGIDFHQWIARRITSLLFGIADIDEGRRMLAEIALSLPMSRQERDRTVDAKTLTGKLLSKLEADHWIEAEGETVVAAHDVLADALAAGWIFSGDGQATEHLYDALRRAADRDHLNTALTTVDRLAAHADFANIDGLIVVKRLLDTRITEITSCASELMRGRLLPDSKKATLLTGDEALRKAVISDQSTWLSFAHLVERLAEIPAEERNLLSVPGFTECLDAMLASPIGINYVERCAYLLFPDRYREKVFERIIREPLESQTHYLLVALMKGGENPNTVEEFVSTWLAVHAEKNRKCSFLLAAWLEAGGNMELVRDPIQLWLEPHKREREAEFVYKAWLDAGGDKELVRDGLRLWLEPHKTDKEAQFAYKAWLDAGGDKELVRDPIQLWLEQHKTEPEARYVYNAWLYAGGDKEFVREGLRLWLEQHKTDPEAKYIYKVWLDAGGDKELVRDPIRLWLEQHKTEPEALYVYNAWLYAGGDKEFVKEGIRLWLEPHKTEPEAEFVYKAWLDAGGEQELVREPSLAWLHSNRTTHNAVYVAKYLSKIADLPDQTIIDIAIWASTFPDDEDAIFRLSAISQYLYKEELSSQVVDEIFSCSAIVVENIGSGDLNQKLIRSTTFNTLQNLLKSCGNHPRRSTIADEAFSKVISLAFVFYRGSDIGYYVDRENWVLIAARRSMRAGFLDPVRDRAGLEAYSGWLQEKAADNTFAMSQARDIQKLIAP